ncbi:MAG: GNAT family N-acetyltransferase [Bacteroidota bacterium]
MELLQIRDAILEDLPRLQHLEQEIIRVLRPFDPTIRPDPVCLYDLKDYIENPDVKMVVAEANGIIVACGYGLRKQAHSYLDHQEYAYLGFMYIVPEYRGKGVIQKIIQTLKDWAIAVGLFEVRLTVYQNNDPAIRAYEKLGFESHIKEMRLRLN